MWKLDNIPLNNPWTKEEVSKVIFKNNENKNTTYQNPQRHILANQVQKCIQRIICHDKVEFIIISFGGQNNIQKSINVIYNVNRLKKKNHIIISVNTEKAFGIIQILIHDKRGKKRIQKNRNICELPELDKEQLQASHS